MPGNAALVAECEPIYEEMDGWSEITSGMTDYEQLPKNAKEYLRRIEELCDVKIDLISTGPGRGDTIVLRPPFGAAK